jgi:hypothetical protein
MSIVRGLITIPNSHAAIACDKHDAFAQGVVSDKQSRIRPVVSMSGLLRSFAMTLQKTQFHIPAARLRSGDARLSLR